MNNQELMAIIEGILFIHGDDGISLLNLETVLDTEKPSAIKNAIEMLEKKYETDLGSSFSIQKFSTNKYRLQTKPHLHSWFAKLEIAQSQSKLSASSIEVLSIIAYKGPIAKSEIDNIRGTDCAYQVYKLKERNLIRSVGKDEENGRANLYSITDNFFKLFNLIGGKESLPQITDEEIEQAFAAEQSKEEQSNKNIFNDNIFTESED